MAKHFSSKDIYELIIIGGGPAGVSAGIYALRKKIKTLLLTKEFGGQIKRTFLVENYPPLKKISGEEFALRLKSHLFKYKAQVKEGIEIIKIKKEKNYFVLEDKDEKHFEAFSLIVATGRVPRKLNVKGENKFLGRGVSYCSVCDGPLFEDKRVAVIGGGNSGLETALELQKYTKKVFILERGERLIADEILVEKAENSSKIEILTNSLIKEIFGKEMVEGILYQDLVSGEEKKLKVEGIFVEIGSLPASSFVKGLLDLEKSGEIKINPLTCETNVAGIFAAGDVTNFPVKQLVTAVSMGAVAGLSAYRYLKENY